NVAAVELGHSSAGRSRAVLRRDVVVARAGDGVVRRRGARLRDVAADVALAAVDPVRGVVRGRVDRPVHRPSLRRQAALIPAGRAVPADRTAVVAELRLPQVAHPVLSSGEVMLNRVVKVAVTAAVLIGVAACQTVNPYTRESQTSKATKGAGIGAAAG